MIDVNDDNFEAEVLKSDVPVLVDFWAPWCGPCKAMGPVFEAVSLEFEGKVKFVKINVDECDSIPAKFGVRGIPTLMAFKAGEVTKSSSGFKTNPQLTDMVNQLVE